MRAITGIFIYDFCLEDQIPIDDPVLEADASCYQGAAPADIDWSDPRLKTRVAREYLAALDPELDSRRKTPKVISLSDPSSAWTAKAKKRVQFGYGLNYLIDNERACPSSKPHPHVGRQIANMQRHNRCTRTAAAGFP